MQPLQKQLQPLFGLSVDALCHPCITTTHLSYSVLSLKLPPSPGAEPLVLLFPAKNKISANALLTTFNSQGTCVQPIANTVHVRRWYFFGAGTLLWNIFFWDPSFFQKKPGNLYPPFLGQSWSIYFWKSYPSSSLEISRFPKKVDAFLNPYYTLIKNSTQTIFQGSTTWVTKILNNVIVWMVPYGAPQLWGIIQKQFIHHSLGEADPLYEISMVFPWDS